MTRAALLAAMLLLTPVAACAGMIKVFGDGNSTCSAWTMAHAANDEPARRMDAWAYGYITAVNQFSHLSNAPDVTGDVQPQAISALVTLYCAQNPAQYVATALGQLTIELNAR